jgi:hypothetical protein
MYDLLRLCVYVVHTAVISDVVVNLSYYREFDLVTFILKYVLNYLQAFFKPVGESASLLMESIDRMHEATEMLVLQEENDCVNGNV